MSTTINSYSVSLGMDASGYVNGASLSRRETNALIRDIESARTPAEGFANAHNRLKDALDKGAISLGTYNRLLAQKKQQFGFADVSLKDYARSLAGPLAVGLGAVTIATAAATAAGVAFISHMKETQDVIDSVADSANKLGISYNELTGLRFAGQEAGGLDAGTVDASIKKMLVNISKAVDDPDNAVNKAFKRLGLNAGELMKAGPTEAVLKIADGMQGINSQADKLALSMQIFGKSGVDMVSTLESGRDVISESVDFQNKWNGLTDAQVVGVQASNDAWDRIGVVIGGLGTKLSAEMAVPMKLIAESVLNASGGAKKLDENMQLVVLTTAYYLGQLKDIGEMFIAMPMMMAGMGSATGAAFDFSSGQRAMNAVIDERQKLENAARPKKTILDIDAEAKVADKAWEAMVDRVLAEEQKRMDMEDKLARNALQAADKVFEKQRSDALKLRDEIAKGPGAGILADSNEAAKFMADQVNRSLAGDSVAVPGKPTEEMLLEEARKQYEQALADSKKTDEQTALLKKLVEKTQPIGKAR
jgi:hypothetical protein